MNITLHGWAGVIAAALALLGAAWILASAQEGFSIRYTVSLRRLRIYRRWGRPGTAVLLPDGREGVIEDIWWQDEAGDMALVIFDGDGPEWVPLALLAPVPAVAQEVA